jgi:PPOX class probable F420-dependent enzyme
MNRTRSPLGDTKTIRLETRKRDGTWVPTAVSLAVEGDRLFFRTYDAAGKFKRLQNFPEVRVAPSSLLGKPSGPAVPGTARLLEGDEAEHARALLARQFPVLHRRLVPWTHRRKGWQTMHYELTLTG